MFWSGLKKSNTATEKVSSLYPVKLCRGIVDKFPSIHGIEVAGVEKSLTNDQMKEVSGLASAELQNLSASLDKFVSKHPDTKIH